MADKFLVTGGGGFLGRALCLHLRSQGQAVISVSRGRYPELEAAGVQTVSADISSPPENYLAAFEGVSAVFHTAARVDMWGAFDDFYRTNVIGTGNIIEACKSRGVPRLIYTSSPSVIAGEHDLCGVDESVPYPSRYKAFYPQTKAMAERAVIEAGGQGGLSTIVLRPHLIFGPGDTNLVPTILKKADAGKLLRIGTGTNLSDFCFIEDCVHAHVCAESALAANPALSGKKYFISQGDPMPLWGFVDEILNRTNRPVLSRSIPAWLARGLAGGLEGLRRFGVGPAEPVLTSFLVSEMSTSHYFDISAARRDLHFRPRYSMAQALDKTFSFRTS